MSISSLYSVVEEFLFPLRFRTPGDPYSDSDQSELARVETVMAAFPKYVVLAADSRPERGNMITPNLEDITLKIDILGAKIYISYLEFEKMSEAKMVVDNDRTDPKTLASTFRITIPYISETYKYKINGTILNHEVFGEGRMTYGLTNVSLTVSDLKFNDTPYNLQISSMKIDVDINNLGIKFSGLHVAGMELNAFEKVLQADVLSILQKQVQISESTTAEIEATVNYELHGHSLEQVVHWLVKHTMKVQFKSIINPGAL